MITKKTGTCILIVLFAGLSACFSQNFKGTILSAKEPFYGNPPYLYEGSEYYTISFRTDPGVIRALVPEPLEPASNDIIQIAFVKQRLVEPDTLLYGEVYLTIPVTLGETVGQFIPVLYLDVVEAILPGREIYGFNKAGADICFKENENNISVTVMHQDTVIIEAAFVLGNMMTVPLKAGGGGIINLKYIPSLVKDAPPDVKQLTILGSGRAEPEKETNKTRQVRPGRATLAFHSIKYCPMGQIPVLEIVEAGFASNSFTLGHGRVLYDYLKDEEKQND